MTIREMHWEIQRKWNMNANNHRRTLNDVEVDRLIHEATNVYLQYYVHGTLTRPRIKFGIEFNQQRTDMLQTLITTKRIPAEDGTSISTFFPLPKDTYFSYISSRAHRQDCPGQWVNIRIEQHADRATVIKDYHRTVRPEFAETAGFIRDQHLYVLTLDKLLLDNLELTYVRKPIPVHLGTYQGINGEDPPKDPDGNVLPVNSDLPEDYHWVLMDIAVQLLGNLYNDQATQQGQTLQIAETTS